MKQIFFLAIISSLILTKVNAQSTEDFENVTLGSTEFINNSQSFTISSNASNSTYQWLDCNNANAPIVGETYAS